jgi:predicted metal-dependent hydrolase
MHKISVSDISIDVVRKDIKNMHLAVYPPSGRVRIAAPLRIDDEAVRLFAISRIGWIRRQQNKYTTQRRETPREYVNRESHYFQGKRYLLRVIEQDNPPKVIIKNKTFIDLYVRTDASTAQRQAIMNEWYRKELKLAIPPLIEKWQNEIGVKVAEWGIKQMKTKWGTCNIEAKRIWINLELAKKPIHCLEYIIVHEMIHLLERHHNERYLAYLEKFLPNWKFLKNELNRMPASHVEWTY